jgi:hypothetical protein
VRHELIFDHDTLAFLGERTVTTVHFDGEAPGTVVGSAAAVARGVVDHAGDVPVPGLRTVGVCGRRMWDDPAMPDATDFLDLDTQLTDEERAIRDAVRDFAAEELAPHIADWYEHATLPEELGPRLGSLGLLGMHLTGYGCAGLSATAYGVACRELEAVDSGLRSFVSVQGSLAMFAIHHWGSPEQRELWLPRMATGEVIGCFGLTEPDAGSDPGSMRTYARPYGPRRSPGSRSSGPVRTRASAASSCPPTFPGSSPTRCHASCRCGRRGPPNWSSTGYDCPPMPCSPASPGCVVH